MVDQDIVRSKIAHIQHSLQRLREKQSVSLQELQSNEDIQDIVLHNLQNAIQGCLDLASHIIADEGWAIPPAQAGLFQVLSEHQVLTAEQAAEMKAMVGFRNIIVHEYATINMKKVHEVLIKRLQDFDRFCQQVIRYAGL